MKLIDFVEALMRRKWLFAGMVIVSLVVSGITSIYMVKPTYKSSTTLMVSKARDEGETYIDYESYIISQKLVSTYAVVAKSESVLQNTLKSLKLKMSAEQLSKSIEVSQIEETQVLSISAVSTDPVLAASIASGVADSLKKEVARIMNDNSISVIDYAKVPVKPFKPDKKISIAAGLFFGLMAGLFVVYLLEYFDTTVRKPEDVRKYLGMSVIGSVPQAKHGTDGDDELIMKHHPNSDVAEAFRSIRTSIQFANADDKIQTIMFTSAHEGEGKTMIAANLAAALSGIGKRVVLVDCDFRKPRIGHFFGFSNSIGMTDVLMSKKNSSVVIRGTSFENLDVITAGSPVQNPAEILHSLKMKDIFENLEKEYDYIIIDTPAASVTDASITSLMSDAAIIVCSAGKASIEEVRKAKMQLESVNANIMGAIVNRF